MMKVRAESTTTNRFSNRSTQKKSTATHKSTIKKPATTTKNTATTTTTTSSSSHINTFTSTPISHTISSFSYTSHTPSHTSISTPVSTTGSINSGNSSNASSGLSGGAIAGIIIAVIAILAGVVAAIIVRLRRKKKQRALTSQSDPFTVGFSNVHPPSLGSQPKMRSSHLQHYQPQLQPQLLAEGLGVYSVVATYTPTLSDEIDIQIGDKVQLLVEYDDGWCQGHNLTQNCKGVFPKHCLDYTTNESQEKRISSIRQNV